MDTESGAEEFVLLVRGRWVSCIQRNDGQSGYSRDNYNVVEFEKVGWKLVKVYLYPNDVGQWYSCGVYTEIGYHEQRLTALERLSVRCYVGHYWDIPF